MSAETISKLCQEELEMNRVRLEHCNRCHTALKSDTYISDEEKPQIIFISPALCSTCKDVDYSGDRSKKDRLPTEKTGLLVRCRHTDCGGEFYIRPSWFKKQQAVENPALKRWMPELIDPDTEKVKRLLELDTNEEQEVNSQVSA